MKKNMKKALAAMLAAAMTMGMTTAAMAQTVGTAADNTATITIENAAKGETYKIYKLFDATVSTDNKADGESVSIAYTGEIPESLSEYFTEDTAGNIFLAEDKEMNDEMQAALKAWALTQTPTAQDVSDGSEMDFVGLGYGYYIVISSQSETTEGQGGAAITVDSTNPNVTIVDKNSSTPNSLTKTVDDDDVNIGDTVTYTVSFNTSNYDGAGADAKIIESYTIHDTLPTFLDDVTVTKIEIDGEELTVGDPAGVPQFNDEKKIVIDWYYDADETEDTDDVSHFLYDNGASVTITYTAVVTDEADIDGEGNTNTVTLTWQKTEGPDGSVDEANDTIYTYAIALQKVDQSGNALADATFEFPFYVKTTADTDGAYIYAGTEAGDGLTNTLTTPDTGTIVVKGVESGTYSIKETEAPNGYNKLTAPVSVTATQTGKTTTSTTTYLDANGNIVDEETETVVTYTNNNLATGVVVVVNKTGTVLPSTGGMGTTIFYILGSIMALGAGVLLVTKKRVGEN